MQYLKVTFTNIEPFRIADDSTGQSGQTASLRYIPGTSIRGLVINALSFEPDFPDIKKELFSDKTRFLNGYITNDGRDLIPSPKGFYEGKTGDGKLANAVAGEVIKDGMKRAALGSFCSVEGDVLSYYNVSLGSDTRNKIMIESPDEKQNVFRYEYVMPGYSFCAYVCSDNRSLLERISGTFEDEFIIGNARSAGLGKCRLINKMITDATPYDEYSVKEDAKGHIYMMLLSDMTMRNLYGEYCGIDIDELGKRLDADELRIENCSTSTVNIRGYNRKIGAKSASVTMYEKGSVFKLCFSGNIEIDKLRQLQDSGLGVRKSEGFGRVIFLDAYERIASKSEGKLKTRSVDSETRYEEDERVISSIAKNYYKKQIEKALIKTVADNPLKRLRGEGGGTFISSQVGALEARIISNKYDYNAAVSSLNEYYDHALEKEESKKVHKETNSIRSLKEFVFNVRDSALEDLLGMAHKDKIMGIAADVLLTEEEEGRYKLRFLLDAIHYDNRKEDK